MDNDSEGPHRGVTVFGMTGKIMVDTAGATAVWDSGVGSATAQLTSRTPPTVPVGSGPALRQALTEAADDLRRGHSIGRQCLEELSKGFNMAMRNLDEVEVANTGLRP